MLTKEELEKLDKVFILRVDDTVIEWSPYGRMSYLNKTWVTSDRYKILEDSLLIDGWLISYDYLHAKDPRDKYEKGLDEADKVIRENLCNKKGNTQLPEVTSEPPPIPECKRAKGTENQWSDKHYDFKYELTSKDIEKGFIKIDPYLVNRIWRINSWDDTGAAFHSLKNYARISNGKNPLERDLTSLYKQVKVLCKLHGVQIDD